MQTCFVRYMMADEFTEGCGHRQKAAYGSSQVANMLDPLPGMVAQGQMVRPIWLTVDVLKGASPGQYQGTVEVQAGSESIQTLSINLEVSSQKLLSSDQWAFHLDL